MGSPRSPLLTRVTFSAPASDGGTLPATRSPRAVPLLVVAVYDAADLSHADVRLVDVSSGVVVARLGGLSSGGHLGAAGGLVCLVSAKATVRVIDPATGAATNVVGAAAPGDTAPAHNGRRARPPLHVFGHVPATGEYKVLRISAAAAAAPGQSQSQSCEILTIGDREPQRWRPAQGPPAPVAAAAYRSKAVSRGVAHFLLLPPPPHHGATECDAVASFDLGAEAWRPCLLRGPLSSSGRAGDAFRAHLSLAELDGFLAAAHHDYRGGCVDVWQLTDLEQGAWSRTHSVRLASVLRGWGGAPPDEPGRRGRLVAGGREWLAQPLAVLDDGRVALWVEGTGSLRVYDPKTGACTEVADMGRFSSLIGLSTAAIE
ncbi:hypothetical protein PVAP13_9NG076700 [Panicum virgatum]|uniref:F-box associated beta-propeller type 3 domain-containing protein n=1 Tax=Panicum virgatum TaxID=38727 RepID=A0A8T0MIB1_PANVG|nr:hypothetical protein PVAP13_9NG076700 [Panicum virgatum]